MRTFRAFPCASVLALFASPLLQEAYASTYTVGRGTGCTHRTIQAAIDAAQANPGPDTIRITRLLPYTKQALRVSTNERLDIEGGFADCRQAVSDGNYTVIDGSGGATEPVFRINADTDALVRMRQLTVRGGDEDGRGYGGGIYFRGDGILEINESLITANTAGYGAGIYAEGTGTNAELVIGNNVQISSNTARYSGGGVYVEGLEMTMIAPDSWIAFNRAPGVVNPQTGIHEGGYAGGLMVLSGARSAHAYVGSSGIGNAGPIYFNEARFGGGVAVVAHRTVAKLHLFTTDPARPLRIRSNSALVAGGAIYQSSPGDGYSTVHAEFAFIEDNWSPRGGATFSTDRGTSLRFNDGDRHVAAMNCPFGIVCGGIIGNVAENAIGEATGGVVESSVDATAWFERIEFRNNRGRNLIRGLGNGDGDGFIDISTHNVLITGNQTREHLIATDADGWDDKTGYFNLIDTTIAGNLIGSNSVMRVSNKPGHPANFHRSIIWQPRKRTLEVSGSPFNVFSVIASETISLDAGREALLADPRFIDPERGDFRLRAGSPAVDATSVNETGGTRDVFGLLRDRDLVLVPDLRGIRDIGAIERQALLPIVLNADFDADFHLWTNVNFISAWDSTQNAAGLPGSGSVKVSQATSQPRSYGLSQCIHLPGPGTYALNGWGRSGAGGIGNRDYLYLYWEYRDNGGEDCNSGIPDASGLHFLSNQPTWHKPVTPALINVPYGVWNDTASVKITMVVAESGITYPPTTIGWFDGITLEPIP